MKVIASNKKAFFDYNIEEQLEVGLVLLGVEIKAIRARRVNINGSYIRPLTTNGPTEFWWVGSHFTIENGDQTRTKKVLLNKAEMKRWLGKLSAGQYTILPLELYLKHGKAKLKIGLAAKKKKYDKREAIKKRTIERELQKKLSLRG